MHQHRQVPAAARNLLARACDLARLTLSEGAGSKFTSQLESCESNTSTGQGVISECSAGQHSRRYQGQVHYVNVWRCLEELVRRPDATCTASPCTQGSELDKIGTLAAEVAARQPFKHDISCGCPISQVTRVPASSLARSWASSRSLAWLYSLHPKHQRLCASLILRSAGHLPVLLCCQPIVGRQVPPHLVFFSIVSVGSC